MGKVYHDLGELDKSADAYAEALNEPARGRGQETRIGRARVLLDANEAEQASDGSGGTQEASTGRTQVLALAARQARDLGRAEEAEELADRALAGDPDELRCPAGPGTASLPLHAARSSPSPTWKRAVAGQSQRRPRPFNCCSRRKRAWD